MKSSLLLSDREDLFDVAASALSRLAAEFGTEFEFVPAAAWASVADGAGRRITLFGDLMPETIQSAREEECTIRPGVVPPDLATVTICDVECRWEDLFARFTRDVALAAGARCWVMDDASVIWDAADVDPAVVQM